MEEEREKPPPAVAALIDKAVDSSAGEVNPRPLKAIKSTVRCSDSEVHCAAQTLMLMNRDHSQYTSNIYTGELPKSFLDLNKSECSTFLKEIPTVEDNATISDVCGIEELFDKALGCLEADDEPRSQRRRTDMGLPPHEGAGTVTPPPLGDQPYLGHDIGRGESLEEFAASLVEPLPSTLRDYMRSKSPSLNLSGVSSHFRMATEGPTGAWTKSMEHWATHLDDDSKIVSVVVLQARAMSMLCSVNKERFKKASEVEKLHCDLDTQKAVKGLREKIASLPKVVEDARKTAVDEYTQSEGLVSSNQNFLLAYQDAVTFLRTHNPGFNCHPTYEAVRFFVRTHASPEGLDPLFIDADVFGVEDEDDDESPLETTTEAASQNAPAAETRTTSTAEIETGPVAES